MQKPTFFAVLMYFLYDHSRYFNFKRKYQQYGPHLQTVFPFLMTMAFSMAYFCFFSASFSVSLPNSAAAFCYFSFLFFLFLDILHMNSFNILKISLANVLTFCGPWVVLAQSFILWRPIKVSLVILDLPALHIFLLPDRPLSTSLLTLYNQCYLHNLKVYTLYLRSVRLAGFEIM